MSANTELFSQLVQSVIEFTNECIKVPDDDFEEIVGQMIKHCEAHPGAHKLAVLVVDIVRNKRSEVLARTKN